MDAQRKKVVVRGTVRTIRDKDIIKKSEEEVKIMQMCPFCDKVYDESEYSHCPYCSGELEEEDEEIRPCPECGGCLHWDGEIWE